MATVAIPANTTALLLDIEGTTTPITFVKVSFYFLWQSHCPGALLQWGTCSFHWIPRFCRVPPCTLLLLDVKLLLVLFIITIIIIIIVYIGGHSVRLTHGHAYGSFDTKWSICTEEAHCSAQYWLIKGQWNNDCQAESYHLQTKSKIWSEFRGTCVWGNIEALP